MKSCKSVTVYQFVISFFVALSVSLGSLVSYSGELTSSYPQNFPCAPSFTTVGLFVVALAISFGVLQFIKIAVLKVQSWVASKKPRNNKCVGADARHSSHQSSGLAYFLKSHLLFFFGALLAIFACWFVVFLNYYPGTSMNDQLWIIKDPIGVSNNHPLLYNIALAGCVRIGMVVAGSANVGFALYILAQMVLCAGVVAFCVLWLRYRGAGKVLAWIVVAFFALVPIISNYSICIIKDTLFGYVMLLWLPFLYEAIGGSKGFCSGVNSKPQFWKKRSSYILFALLIISTALVRNNGLYVGFGLAIVLVFAFRKIAWKKIACTALVALVLCMIPSQIVSAMGIKQLFRESVGIPLQQMSAVVCADEQGLTSEQQNYIDSIIPLESIKNNYAPMAVDALKYRADFDSNALQDSKAEFFKVYLELGATHPSVYTEAWLAQTWGYWAVTAPVDVQSYFFKISDNVQTDELALLQQMFGLENRSLYPQEISDWFSTWYEQAVKVVPGPGLLFALLLLAAFVLMVAKKKEIAKWILLVLPWVFLWATLMISVPISSSLRYVFPMLVVLPFFVALAVMAVKESITEETAVKAEQ